MPALFLVDAFADAPFTGGVAGVVPLDGPAPEAWMQRVAREVNAAETAFFWPEEGTLRLRWFTPTTEVPLCGHATLAAAHVLFEEGRDAGSPVRFLSKGGPLAVQKDGADLVLDFPVRPHARAAAPPTLAEALGQKVVETWHSGAEDWLVVLDDETAVRACAPDLAALATLHPRATIVTAPSADPAFDYVHRYFAPSWGIPEDPATGSIQCSLGPYWAARLGKRVLRARQLSTRGATMRVEPKGARVEISGRAVTTVRGTLAHGP